MDYLYIRNDGYGGWLTGDGPQISVSSRKLRAWAVNDDASYPNCTLLLNKLIAFNFNFDGIDIDFSKNNINLFDSKSLIPTPRGKHHRQSRSIK